MTKEAVRVDASPDYSIARYLPDMAARLPDKDAVIFPRGRGGPERAVRVTFSELNALCDRYAHGLAGVGIEPGMRSLLMVRPSPDFFALTFALFKIGAVPILIDPGMGWGNFMRCVAQVAPEGFLGVPMAHVLRTAYPRYFSSVRVPVTLGMRLWWKGPGLRSLPVSDDPFPVKPVCRDEVAAILFTTGSTGPAKGVTYTHRIFLTQMEILRREYGIGPADVDLACFPLFALFSTGLGATAVVPDMNPSRPAFVDPNRIIGPIAQYGVTYSFGSPTLWANVGRHCVANGIRLPGVSRIIMAGAPVPAHVHDALLGHVLPPGAETFTPYGATESLPVANFRGSEMLAETAADTCRGAGMCVGVPLPEVEVRIIRVSDEAIEGWSDELVLPTGEIGEVVTKGPMVTPDYHGLPEATRLAKISDGPVVRHRMGDLGYLDETGRLWFCGRKAHRVETGEETLYTVCCEAIVNEHPGVFRSALVGIGTDRYRQLPVIVVEPEKGAFPRSRRERERFGRDILETLAASTVTHRIRHVLFRRTFPVDIRHNAKIRREDLAAWAATEKPVTAEF